MSTGMIIDLSKPESSISEDELDLYLSKSIESYRDIKKRINKNTALSYLCILLSAAILGGLLTTPEVFVPGTGIGTGLRLQKWFHSGCCRVNFPA